MNLPTFPGKCESTCCVFNHSRFLKKCLLCDIIGVGHSALCTGELVVTVIILESKYD